MMDNLAFRAYYIYSSMQLLLESNGIHLDRETLNQHIDNAKKTLLGMYNAMKDPESLMKSFSKVMDKYDPDKQIKHSISRLHPYIKNISDRAANLFTKAAFSSSLGTVYNLIMMAQSLISLISAFVLETLYLGFIFVRYIYKGMKHFVLYKEGRKELIDAMVSIFNFIREEFFEPTRAIMKTLLLCIEIVAPSLLPLFVAPYGLVVKCITTFLLLSGSVIKFSTQGSQSSDNNLLPTLLKLFIRYVIFSVPFNKLRSILIIL